MGTAFFRERIPVGSEIAAYCNTLAKGLAREAWGDENSVKSRMGRDPVFVPFDKPVPGYALPGRLCLPAAASLVFPGSAWEPEDNENRGVAPEGILLRSERKTGSIKKVCMDKYDLWTGAF
jgi:hypothetical protein